MPLTEVVAGGRGCRQRDCGACLGRGRTGRDRTVLDGAVNGDAVQRHDGVGRRRHRAVEHARLHGDGLQRGGLTDGDCAFIYSRRCARLGSIHCVVDGGASGGAGDGHVLGHVIRACSGCEGRGGNRTHGREVGHIVAGFRHRERVGGVGGHFRTSLRPVREQVARVGRGRQRGGLSVVVGACAAHRTAGSRVGRGRNGVAVEFEDSDESVVVGHRYLARI